MDPTIVSFAKELAPSAVYLVGLVYALKHIGALYQSRHEVLTQAHERELKILAAGHEARFKLLEAQSLECVEDRRVLREEMNLLRERLDSQPGE